MQTKILVDDDQLKRANEHWGSQYRKAYWRGLLLRERSDFWDSYRRFTANKQAGPLTAQRLAEITAQQDAEETYAADRSKEAITVDLTAENASSFSTRFQYAFLLQEFLKERSDIKSAANIGARVDLWSAYLARRFPDVQFLSIDFQSKLAEHNAYLPQSSNWHFMPGYCIDLLRSGRLRVDLYFSISTTVLMNNRELNVYLDEIAKHAKAVSFCEGWWPRADGIKAWLEPRTILPEEVPKERPYCSGAYANYHHNYIAKLTERGFKIRLSQIVPFQENFHYLQIIAERY